MDNLRFTRLSHNKTERYHALGRIMGNPEGIRSETWLFVSPHDDDVCMGAGLWLQAAAQAGVNARVNFNDGYAQCFFTLYDLPVQHRSAPVVRKPPAVEVDGHDGRYV